jgi:RNA polymerase primary sigma factor
MRQLRIVKQITTREENSLEKYLLEIRKIDLNSTEEELDLVQRMKNGDSLAFEKLITANLRFVVSVAKQFQNQGLSLPDLISEGNLGLIIALRRFDETRGFKLISYAVWWIRQSILRALAEDSRAVRLPLNRIGLLSKIKKMSSAFEQNNERYPSVEEIAETLESSVDEVKEIFRASNRILSLERSFSKDEEEGCLLDVIPSSSFPETDGSLIRESISLEVRRAVESLPDREKEIIKMFFGIGCKAISLEEIGKHFELSRERTRQIKEKAIKRLRFSRKKVLERAIVD